MSQFVPPKRHRGFTLIELLIAVAIVGILASVAVPQYKDYVRRGSLSEAFSQLSDYRVKMEQYYQDNRSYGTTTCADGAAAPAWKTFVPNGAKNFGYVCGLTNSGQGYTITATGKTGTVSVGHVYTINQANVQATTTFKGTAVAKTCWLAKGTEC